MSAAAALIESVVVMEADSTQHIALICHTADLVTDPVMHLRMFSLIHIVGDSSATAVHPDVHTDLFAHPTVWEIIIVNHTNRGNSGKYMHFHSPKHPPM